MVTDLDIHRSARLLVDHHGDEAPMQADAMLEKGDIVGLLVGREDDNITTEATRTQPVHEPHSSVSCDYGTPAAGRFFVKGREINFRFGPGTNYKRVINQKATQILGKTHYRTLGPSKVLEGRYETNEWLQAKIV